MPSPQTIAALVSALIEPTECQKAIAALSAHLNIDSFILFLPDTETGRLLAAPGFPQTLPHGRQWQAFLRECAARGQAEWSIPSNDSERPRPVRAFAAPDGGVVAFIGGMPEKEALNEFMSLWHLLSTALKSQRVTAMHAAQAQIASDLSRQSAELARRLDEARAAAQKELAARVSAERLARTRELQLRAIVDTTPECVKLVAADGTLLEMNDAGLKMIGAQAREQAVGKSVYDLIAPEFREAFREMHERVLAGGRERLEFQTIGLEGTRKWMETHAVPIAHPGNGRTVQLSITRDITSRKQDEALLSGERTVLELLARGRDLADILSALALTFEAQIPGALASILLLERDQGKLLHGAAPSLPDSFNQAVHGMSIGCNIASCGAAAFSRERVLVEDIQSHPNWLPFRSLTAPLGLRAAWSQPILASTGEVIGTFGVYLREPRLPTQRELRLMERLAAFAAIPIERQRADTALQSARSELQRYAEELEKRVAERTAELSETIGELEAFSYSIAHDMRSPLRAMQGYSSYIVEEFGHALDPKAVHALDRISTSAMRLDRLIQDVLNYSRIVRGDVDLHPVDAHQLVCDILDSYEEWHPPKAEVVLHGRLPFVIANDALLTQCVTNLVGNAVKFVRAGNTPHIVISRQDINANEVQIRIRDNGVGIDKKDQDRIFRIFERVHHAKEYEGTGIGLAIARKAAERMRGTLGLESSLGKGSVFWIQLRKAQV